MLFGFIDFHNRREKIIKFLGFLSFLCPSIYTLNSQCILPISLSLSHSLSAQVTFFLTGSLGLRRRRGSDQGQGQVQHSRMAVSDSQLYRELAQSSGGQAIQVTKTELPKATSIIVESSSSSLVALTPIVNIRVTLGPQCEGWDKRVLISHNSSHKCGRSLNKGSMLVQGFYLFSKACTHLLKTLSQTCDVGPSLAPMAMLQDEASVVQQHVTLGELLLKDASAIFLPPTLSTISLLLSFFLSGDHSTGCAEYRKG